MFTNILPEVCSCLVMALVAFGLLRISRAIVPSFVWIGICVLVYFATLYLFPKDRKIIVGIKEKALSTIRKPKKRKRR